MKIIGEQKFRGEKFVQRKKLHHENFRSWTMVAEPTGNRGKVPSDDLMGYSIDYWIFTVPFSIYMYKLLIVD